MTELRDRLVAAARAALENSYSPYSGFRVGAAVIDQDGVLHVGTNVENASLGLSICAERVAAFAAAATGSRHLTAVAVVTETAEPTPPCGACRQVLREFGDVDLPIWIAGRGEAVEQFCLDDLLPRSFSTYLDEEIQ
jgi:cytidine deaminase